MENRKYTKEELAKLKSVAVNKGGRTKHTSAGSVQAKVEEKRTEDDFVRVTTDVQGSTITEHKDGRQDCDVHPEPLLVNLTQSM